MNEYNSADLLLFHHAYDHAPNTLVPPPSTKVGNINNVDKGHSAGWDGLERGGHDAPLQWRQSLLSSTAAEAWGPTINVLHLMPLTDGPLTTLQLS